MYDAVCARKTKSKSTKVQPNFIRIARHCQAKRFGKTKLQSTSSIRPSTLIFRKKI